MINAFSKDRNVVINNDMVWKSSASLFVTSKPTQNGYSMRTCIKPGWISLCQKFTGNESIITPTQTGKQAKTA
jgi:hypothetical protein